MDELAQPAVIGTTRVGGVDLNKARIRTTLGAVTALAAAPYGFTVAKLTAKVNSISPGADDTVRQGAYDLCKLRAHEVITKPGHGRRYCVAPHAALTIVALLVLHDQVIGPIVAGVHSPRLGRKPAHWTAVDRDYEALRIDMQTLFADLAVTTEAA